MAEYIEKEAFKGEYLCCGYLPEMAEEEFDSFPAADVVEVVRCKDCKHFVYGEFCDGPHTEQGLTVTITETDFCSRGERRESK